VIGNMGNLDPLDAVTDSMTDYQFQMSR